MTDNTDEPGPCTVCKGRRAEWVQLRTNGRETYRRTCRHCHGTGHEPPPEQPRPGQSP